MKVNIDKKRRDVVFEVGDMVHLKIQPYKHCTMATRMNEKFAPHYFGPYKVIQCIGPAAYTL